MNKRTSRPVGSTLRLLLMATLALMLALGTGLTTARAAAGPAPVNLGAAAPFAVLAETGISTVPTSAITGNLGVSPYAATSITGFALVADSTNTFSKSSQVTGEIYAADYAPPTPANMTTAIGNMEAAYNDAAGRSIPDFTELYSGNLSGRTLAPGLYKWSTDVLVTTNVELAGASNDVWIFQIAGDLTLTSGATVTLSGGAQAENIFWQVAGGTGVEIGTTAHVEGTILAKKAIHLRTGASLNGRAMAQSAVTLDAVEIVIPRPRQRTFLSGGTFDGWVRESTESSSVGGANNHTATTLRVGDTEEDQQYVSILHFDVSLPNKAVIASAKLMLNALGPVGTDPFSTHHSLRADIRAPFFASAADLQNSDFQAAADGLAVSRFRPTPVAVTWYPGVLNPTGRSLISRTDTTQFRLRFTMGDNDNATADYMRFFSGDAGAADAPQLIVYYYVP